MTICCLNPGCTNPENADGTKFCISCGTPIAILRNHYRPLSLLSHQKDTVYVLYQSLQNKPHNHHNYNV
ncbi:MAG: 4-Cys prefix domain-containing protein [Crocosphaera sp.]